MKKAPVQKTGAKKEIYEALAVHDDKMIIGIKTEIEMNSYRAIKSSGSNIVV